MPETSSIFETIDPDTEARAIATARAEIAAGQGVSHADMVKWLQSWGKASEASCPMPAPQ